jgi:hypothetical protein
MWVFIILMHRYRKQQSIDNQNKNSEKTVRLDIPPMVTRAGGNAGLDYYLNRWEKEEYIKIDNPAEYWNNYWQAKIASGAAQEHFFYFEITDQIVPLLRKLNLTKILCVGNGISLEAPALAYAGFQVDVLDISSAAITYLSNYQLTDKDLMNFYRADQYRPGGKIDYIVGDFTDINLCPGPYDLIITRRTLQYFTRNNFIAVINTLIARLNDGGVFINHSHNAYDIAFAIEDYLCSRDFIKYQSEADLTELKNGKKLLIQFGSSG